MSLRPSALAVAIAATVLPTLATAGTLDRVVAVVDNDVILASELERRLKSGDSSGEPAAVLEDMIDEVLLVREAESRYIGASQDEVDKAIDEIKAANKLTDHELEERLAEMGYSLEEYRHDVERQIMALRLVNIEVNAKHAGAGADEVRVARRRYVGELRSRAYIDVRLGGAR